MGLPPTRNDQQLETEINSSTTREPDVQQVRGISADEGHAAVIARLVALRQVTLEFSGVR
jgi:hypothetical protein